MQAPHCFAVAALLFVLAGCANSASDSDFVASAFTAVAPAADAAPGAPADYRLSAGDLLDISVFQVPDLTEEVQIDASGQIALPLIGPVEAAGQTTQALESEIATKLRAKYMQAPQVSVFLKSSAGEQVTVDGPVTKPGVYPIVGRLTLLQALANAGDLLYVADPSDIIVFRQVNGQRQAAKFSLDEIRAGRAVDPALQAGDTVVVASSTTRAFLQSLESALPIAGTFAPFAARIP